MRTLFLLSLVGCCPPSNEVPYTFEDWIPYAYTSFDPKGTVLAKGTVSIAPLRPGSRRIFRRWDVKAVSPGDQSFLHTGAGLLDGRISGHRVWIEFHPETAGTDRGFELEGNLTSSGAKGDWGYTNEGGVHPHQGSFTLTREGR